MKQGLSSETDEKCHTYAHNLAQLSPTDVTKEMIGLLNEARIETEKYNFSTTGVILYDLAELTVNNSTSKA